MAADQAQVNTFNADQLLLDWQQWYAWNLCLPYDQQAVDIGVVQVLSSVP